MTAAAIMSRVIRVWRIYDGNTITIYDIATTAIRTYVIGE